MTWLCIIYIASGQPTQLPGFHSKGECETSCAQAAYLCNGSPENLVRQCEDNTWSCSPEPQGPTP